MDGGEISDIDGGGIALKKIQHKVIRKETVSLYVCMYMLHLFLFIEGR